MSLTPVFSTLIPSLINAGFQHQANQENMSNYLSLQRQANAFAKSERIASQEYNSPRNQLQLMAQAGMNPNLLNGSSFEPTSGVSNQSVSPPQVQPTLQLPTEGSYSQSLVNTSSALKNQSEIESIRKDILMKQLDISDREMEVLSHSLDYNEFDLYADPDTGHLSFRNPKLFGEHNNYYVAKNVSELQEATIRKYSAYLDNEVKQAVLPVLKLIPKSQWKNLEADLKRKNLDNTLLQGDVSFFKKYGISPHDANMVQSLLKMMLRDPRSVSLVIDALSKASESTLKNLLGNLKPHHAFGLLGSAANSIAGKVVDVLK